MSHTTKYFNSLRIEGNKVISYTTHVATIVEDELHVHGYWSRTTSKHINHVADVNNLTKYDKPVGAEVEKVEEVVEERQDNPFKAVGMVAAFGEIFADTQKDKNDWKLRMIKAGMGEGLIMPEDWDTLSEDEKETRLNKIIEVTKEKI